MIKDSRTTMSGISKNYEQALSSKIVQKTDNTELISLQNTKNNNETEIIKQNEIRSHSTNISEDNSNNNSNCKDFDNDNNDNKIQQYDKYWRKLDDKKILSFAKEHGIIAANASTNNASFLNKQLFQNCYIKNKTYSQKVDRFIYLQNNIIRGNWSTEEDSKILILVNELGFQWSIISKYMLNRTAKQIRSRFLNVLHPKLNKTRFSKDEDDKILKFYIENGPKWTELSLLLTGRTGENIKRRFHSCLKTKRLKDFKDQYNSNNRNNKLFDVDYNNIIISECDTKVIEDITTQKDNNNMHFYTNKYTDWKDSKHENNNKSKFIVFKPLVKYKRTIRLSNNTRTKSDNNNNYKNNFSKSSVTTATIIKQINYDKITKDKISIVKKRDNLTYEGVVKEVKENEIFSDNNFLEFMENKEGFDIIDKYNNTISNETYNDLSLNESGIPIEKYSLIEKYKYAGYNKTSNISNLNTNNTETGVNPQLSNIKIVSNNNSYNSLNRNNGGNEVNESINAYSFNWSFNNQLNFFLNSLRLQQLNMLQRIRSTLNLKYLSLVVELINMKNNINNLN